MRHIQALCLAIAVLAVAGTTKKKLQRSFLGQKILIAAKMGTTSRVVIGNVFAVKLLYTYFLLEQSHAMCHPIPTLLQNSNNVASR